LPLRKYRTEETPSTAVPTKGTILRACTHFGSLQGLQIQQITIRTIINKDMLEQRWSTRGLWSPSMITFWPES
jgi:hypothetical protein